MCGFCNVWVCVCVRFVMCGWVLGGFYNVRVCVYMGFVIVGVCKHGVCNVWVCECGFRNVWVYVWVF